jgi:hypothetical protein
MTSTDDDNIKGVLKFDWGRHGHGQELNGKDSCLILTAIVSLFA